MMTHCLTYFTSIGRFRQVKVMMKNVSSGEMKDGTTCIGGTSLRMFANDGETSYLVQHPTWVFASSVHLARPLQTCWPTHLSFHLLFSTILTSVQKTKRD